MNIFLSLSPPKHNRFQDKRSSPAPSHNVSPLPSSPSGKGPAPGGDPLLRKDPFSDPRTSPSHGQTFPARPAEVVASPPGKRLPRPYRLLFPPEKPSAPPFPDNIRSWKQTPAR